MEERKTEGHTGAREPVGTSEGRLRARVKWKQRGQCRAEWEEGELDEWRVTWLHADQVTTRMSAMWGGCLYT